MVSVQDMSVVFSVRHAERHGTSGVVLNTESGSSRPDGAEPVVVVGARLRDERDSNSNSIRG